MTYSWFSENIFEEEIVSKLKIAVVKRNLSNVYLVGGTVRDNILKQGCYDFDVSCLSTDKIILQMEFQSLFAIYRPESKLRFSKNHQMIIKQGVTKGETVETVVLEPTVITKSGKEYKIDFKNLYKDDPKEDALSRDFTFNSIFYDLKNEKFVDFYNVF